MCGARGIHLVGEAPGIAPATAAWVAFTLNTQKVKKNNHNISQGIQKIVTDITVMKVEQKGALVVRKIAAVADDVDDC